MSRSMLMLVLALCACGSSDKDKPSGQPGTKQNPTDGASKPRDGGGTFCLPPKISCGGCVDPMTDPGHCGGCGKSCGSDLCVVGSCQAAGGDCREEGNACPNSYYCDLGSGQCKPGCATDEHCAGNACNPLSHACCEVGQKVCAGQCVDLKSAAAHCGQCGNACPAEGGVKAVCTAGQCGLGCDGSLTLCDDYDYNHAAKCVDVQSDPQHCGGCNNACEQPYGGSVSCTAGKCQGTCPGGQTACGDECVDIQSDVSNCGGCGTTCTSASGTPSCVAGQCEVTCPTGETLCDGVCVDLETNKLNCGTCGKVCPDGRKDVSYPVCKESKCEWACHYGAFKCGKMCCAPGEPCCGSYCLKPGYYC